MEGHVKIVTMHILVEMEEMSFYSLEELNRVLRQKVIEENSRNFEGLSYSRADLFSSEEKKVYLMLTLELIDLPIASVRFSKLMRSPDLSVYNSV